MHLVISGVRNDPEKQNVKPFFGNGSYIGAFKLNLPLIYTMHFSQNLGNNKE